MTKLYYEHFQIGVLEEEGSLNLVYDDRWIQRKSSFPISVTMPLSGTKYGPDRNMTWLANLLPESHLSEIGLKLKVSPQDVIGLLKHLGRDTAGAISVDAPRQRDNTTVLAIETENDLEKIIDELPNKPFLVGTKGVSMSLAGVQEKLPVYMLPDGSLGIPTDGTPSTHILKPDAPKKRLPASVQNEAFCMRLAKQCGLDVADVTTGRAGSRTYLLVERYDRIRDNKNVVRRIHQEDFCQVLGFLPSHKYERSPMGGRNGPSLVNIFDAVGNYISLGEREKFLDAVIFNVLICNTDAHAKNYSILIGQGGSTKLAPLYDLMCAEIYPDVDKTMAQAIAGKSFAADLHGSDWSKLAQSVNMSPAKTMRRVKALTELVIVKTDFIAEEIAATPAGDHPLLHRVAFEVKKRAERILRQLSNDDVINDDD